MEGSFNPYNIPEIRISYSCDPPAHLRPRIDYSEDAYEVALAYWDKNRIELVEQFKVMFLNRCNRLIGISEIGTGGLDRCAVDRRIIFGIALKAAASSIVLVHNHPSGDVGPSEADMNLTRILNDTGKVLDITVRDHLVITPHNYFSFADDGIMPE